MKVLLCHTYYQQRGGEDQSFDSEAALLESSGHDVVRYARHNDEISKLSKIASTLKTIWNRQTYGEVRSIIQRFRPEVMHCTNTFPLLSPSIYYAAKSEGVPVVQSLRNYRQLCPVAVMTRDGKLCEDCLGQSFAWSGVRHACYRGSRAATAVVAGMSTLHGMLGTWSRMVTRYFALSKFAKEKFVQAGWDAAKIAVKPNFVHPDPGMGIGQGNYAVFVGRLSPEKGIQTLIDAWSDNRISIPLKIIGDGPLEEKVRQAAAENPKIQRLGSLGWAEALETIGNAKCLVMPSVWYETFGRTIIEAFAKGTPVIASNLGAMVELIDEGRTGFLFAPGDAHDLVKQVERLLGDEAARQDMRSEVRREFEQRYTASQNLEALLAIYNQAINARGDTEAALEVSMASER